MNKRFSVFVFGMSMLVAGSSMAAAYQEQPSNQLSAKQLPDVQDVRISDSKKQVARLSRKLKLKGVQKKSVLAILSDRDRNIELIQESEVLSEEAKASRIATIVAEYNAHIESILNDKQKPKFEQVLIRQRDRQERNGQASLLPPPPPEMYPDGRARQAS